MSTAPPAASGTRPGAPAARGTANIAAALADAADRHPERLAAIIARGVDSAGRGRYERLTFRELHADSDRVAAGLREFGLTRGMRTILMVRPGADFFSLVFALFKLGAVPVVVDPGMGRNRMIDCLAEARAEAFIGVPLAQAMRIAYRRRFSDVRHVVTVGSGWSWGGTTLARLRNAAPRTPFPAADSAPDETAAILFTSGSTGPAKGVVYRHRTFAAQLDALRGLFDFGDDEIDLATFPLFALFDPALGMTCVIPKMDFTRPARADPRKLFRTIHELGVTSMFASPALLDRLGRYGEAGGVRLPTLRRAVSAGAPVSPRILERFATLLSSEARVFTPYGATEALPVASINHREIGGELRAITARGGGVCVGRPAGDVDVRIIRVTDDPLPAWSDELTVAPGQIGEIAVRGSVVTREYWSRPQATAAAKIGATTGDLFHRMGDVGYFDEQGRLWMCGRKSQRVETPTGPLFPVCVEEIFNQHPRVLRTALVGVGTAPAQTPVLCVEVQPGVRWWQRGIIRRELLAIAAGHALTREIGIVLFHPRFPVDVRHNAKIFREKLARWAQRRLGPHPQAGS
ncbi:MAG: Long-chain-fatty-acid--CoA ligase [Phycisphaerae bacterium]|nr:Long-chain-fatty-acid--CoA ligase [Phycisphaerae bacterium]